MKRLYNSTEKIPYVQVKNDSENLEDNLKQFKNTRGAFIADVWLYSEYI